MTTSEILERLARADGEPSDEDLDAVVYALVWAVEILPGLRRAFNVPE